MPEHTPWEPGAWVAERYVVEAVLGRGAFGCVYRVQDLELGETVALKSLGDLDGDSEAAERFRREVRLARRVSHPNVVRTYDLGADGGVRFVTMEYVDGGTLRGLLRARGALPPGEAVAVTRQVARGLAAAHEAGVVHPT
ncbi:MAG: serine/threonine-protein kinase [Myxococcota bacterium]